MNTETNTETTTEAAPAAVAEYVPDFTGDISLSLAQAAHSGISMVPEKRAQTTVSEFERLLRETWEKLRRHANTPQKLEQLAGEFATFRAGLVKRYRAYLASQSRIVSTMIAGPSNFPVRRMQKRNDVAHRRLTEYLEFLERAQKAIVRNLHPEARPIMSGDADAVERLEKEIAAAKALQEAMREVNVTIRKHRTASPEAVRGAVAGVLRTHGVSRGDPLLMADKLLTPDFAGRIGFADFDLSNNSANIRRMEKRLEALKQAKATPDSAQEGEHARLEDCPAENRVRLFFPGKPDESVRSRLKGAGFRWTPSLGCWQAYRNYHTLEAAKREAGVSAQTLSGANAGNVALS